MTAADIINDYIARRAPSFLTAPWRHPNPLVRALWHKQAWWIACEEMAGAARPAADYDIAYDAAERARAKYEAVMREAIDLRAIERAVYRQEAAA